MGQRREAESHHRIRWPAPRRCHLAPVSIIGGQGPRRLHGLRLLLADQRSFNGAGPAAGAWTSVKETGEAAVAAALDFQLTHIQKFCIRGPGKSIGRARSPGERRDRLRSPARAHGGKTIPPRTHRSTAALRRGRGEADAAALLADVLGARRGGPDRPRRRRLVAGPASTRRWGAPGRGGEDAAPSAR